MRPINARESVRPLIRKIAPGVHEARHRRWQDRRAAETGRIAAQLVESYGVVVPFGPFAGMTYWPILHPREWAGRVLPCMLGVYEFELWPVMDVIADRGYRRLINIGAGEGYYSVGLARKIPQLEVWAFDTDRAANQYARALANANGVEIHVEGLCTHETLRGLCNAETLVICDIEGAEVELLDTEVVPALLECDILVELHDVLRPGVSETLLPRFAGRHIELTWTREGQRPPVNLPLSTKDAAEALNEYRLGRMSWSYIHG